MRGAALLFDQGVEELTILFLPLQHRADSLIELFEIIAELVSDLRVEISDHLLQCDDQRLRVVFGERLHEGSLRAI
ncbi:hypothetical protein CWO89_40175 [Bradyrhizobium sp. Leo170]|nr:hypothetical protein CWO89_40175 [Bradyrhizobium sp. Leo170]